MVTTKRFRLSCLLCVEYEAKRMTGWEVDRAGIELVFSSDGQQIQHLQELIDRVRKDRLGIKDKEGVANEEIN